MNDEYRFTCSPSADADLAGTPARLHAFDGGRCVLNFTDGSFLEVCESDLEEIFVLRDAA